MGQKPEEIEKEIIHTREELGEKVEELADRFRETTDEVKAKGLRVAGIALAAVAAILVIKRLRR